MELQKRQYQDDCLANIAQAYREGCYQQLVVCATGTGKAVIAARLYAKATELLGHKPKMLVFAHREELVNQLVATMAAINPCKVGKEMAEDRADVDCEIVVSCVASIGREGATRLARFGCFDVVVCDEAHHSIASTYLNVFEATGVLRPDSKKLLVGFTATPKRKNLTRKERQQVTTLDQENILQLSSVYKKIVYSYTIRKAVKDGYLVRLKGFRVKTDVQLDDVKITAGDYQQDELQKVVNNPTRNQLIVKAWLDNMEGRKTVGFTSGIKHAQDLAAEFMKYGVQAKAVWGVDPERAEKLAQHRAGEFPVLLNAQLLTEGFDDWSIRCIISAAPTTNPSKFTQEIGRGTRLQEGVRNLVEAIKEGYALSKVDCYILDVVDNTKRNHLVTFPSLLGLAPDMNLKGKDIVEAVEIMEELQDKYPGVDLSGLVDITNVKAYIESIDMFAEPYTEEVKEFSKLAWIHTQAGGYVLSIPEKKELSDAKAYARFLHEKLRIDTNELEEFELSITSTETEKRLGVYRTLQEAFASADEVILRCRSSRAKLIMREATWHQYPASEAAKKYLRKLTKKKPLLKCLCEGLHRPGVCARCGKEAGITAGQAALALNILKTK